MFWVLIGVAVAIALELFFNAFLFIFARPRILKWVGSWFTKFTIHAPDRSDYLTRYYILRTKRLKIYIHQFHRSDGDRDPHGHPWTFVSLILYSGYTEWMRGKNRRYYQGNILLRKPTDFHMVSLIPDESTHQAIEEKREIEAWTLVFVGKKTHEWGFQTADGFIHHRDYFDMKFGKGQWQNEPDAVAAEKEMED
jgi:hypothetical protein